MKTFTTYLNDFSFDYLVNLWDEYARDNYPDAYIYDGIEEFIETYDTDAIEATRMVFFGDVRSLGDYVYLNGYGNFQSCWDVESSPIDLDELAKWMKDTNHYEYKEWLDNIEAYDFADWLGGELTNEELTELWSEYIQEVDEDDLDGNGLPLNFDIEDLAREMMVDWRQHFDDFIEAHI
jgi:hypothetical protein